MNWTVIGDSRNRDTRSHTEIENKREKKKQENQSEYFVFSQARVTSSDSGGRSQISRTHLKCMRPGWSVVSLGQRIFPVADTLQFHASIFLNVFSCLCRATRCLPDGLRGGRGGGERWREKD